MHKLTSCRKLVHEKDKSSSKTQLIFFF